ncbi:uncharacterized protein wrm1 [Atheta coriaria]|uniref:uncharacterized protein wrm1 n=1 Tax=Dalotia coriaria TaxID=877792 RepID=UPI0031F44174
MSVLDINERRAYLQSPYFKKHEYGDFSPFYITVTVCTIIAAIIIIINIVGCCSKYSTYWNDRHTGNRWIVSLWTATPHLQPSLDYSELDPKFIPSKVVTELPRDVTQYSDLEVELPSTHEQYQYEPRGSRQQPIEYLELHQKSRESDI